MSVQPNNGQGFKHDMQRDPHELESEADAVRLDMEQTMEALERQFSPGELFNQFYRMLRENGSGFGANLATQVRNNPVPAVLTGIGLAWLASASKRPPVEHSSSGSGSSAMGAAKDASQRAAASGRGAMDSAGSSMRSARDSASRATSQSVRAARDGYDYLQREQPLVLGAAAVACGALLGALLPNTEQEDRLAGEASDDATTRIKDAATRQAQEAKEKASSAAHAATDELRSESSGGSSATSR